MYNIEQIMFAFFIVLCIATLVILFGVLRKVISDHGDYTMNPEQPPIKWMIDIVPCKGATGCGVEEYVVKRLDPKQRFEWYDVIAFFKTYEEAEAFVAEHFHFPMGYRRRPLPISEPEVEA